jgi:pyruvate formate lyase activating enzyme
VTLSGGEPLMQPEFVEALINECRKDSIPVYLDTCGHADPEVFNRIASMVDGILFDLKLMDEEQHREVTGAGNERILENFRAVCGINDNVIVRAVVVPEINDNLENHSRMAEFLHECGFSGVIDLLTYHDYGKSKYAHLGYDFMLEDTRPPTEEKMQELAAYHSAQGFNVNIN